MNETMHAYAAWADIRDAERTEDFQFYVHNIAEARHVTRRAMRIVDEQAKRHGLEPLMHQMLLQVYGANRGRGITVGNLATRLDIVAAFASRMVKRLEELGLVRREPSTQDRRSIYVLATDAGVRTLAEIDDGVHHNVAHLQHQLDEGQQLAAMTIFAFYVGLRPDSPIATAIRAEADAWQSRT
jgi:DNA-binding MarR family transcriptional regulator